MHMDARDLLAEMERVKDRCAACGQDVANAGDIFPLLQKPYEPAGHPRLKFRFLCGPKEIIKGPDGRMSKLVVTENLLVKKGEGTAAKATDQTATLDIDTMIFAIGDAHDPEFGLPMGPEGYSTKPLDGDERSKYQVVDPQTGAELPGFFVVGWSRRASDGLVGIARHDAEVGATHALKYIDSVTDVTNISPDDIETALRVKRLRIVNKPQIEKLNKIEEIEAKARGLAYFKFPDNESMLRAIENEIPESVNATSAD
jgi:ferredoxin--NADP+ reductase